mgnify:CR=1 FL=1
MIELATADSYFAEHLKASVWDGLSDTEKRAALNAAEYDVVMYLNLDEIDTTSSYQINACCEQAIFLNQYQRDLEAAGLARAAGVASERIEGQGAITFKKSWQGLQLAPRARAFADRARGNGFTIIC